MHRAERCFTRLIKNDCKTSTQELLWFRSPGTHSNMEAQYNAKCNDCRCESSGILPFPHFPSIYLSCCELSLRERKSGATSKTAHNCEKKEMVCAGSFLKVGDIANWLPLLPLLPLLLILPCALCDARVGCQLTPAATIASTAEGVRGDSVFRPLS